MEVRKQTLKYWLKSIDVKETNLALLLNGCAWRFPSNTSASKSSTNSKWDWKREWISPTSITVSISFNLWKFFVFAVRMTMVIVHSLIRKENSIRRFHSGCQTPPDRPVHRNSQHRWESTLFTKRWREACLQLCPKDVLDNPLYDRQRTIDVHFDVRLSSRWGPIRMRRVSRLCQNWLNGDEIFADFLFK